MTQLEPCQLTQDILSITPYYTQCEHSLFPREWATLNSAASLPICLNANFPISSIHTRYILYMCAHSYKSTFIMTPAAVSVWQCWHHCCMSARHWSLFACQSPFPPVSALAPLLVEGLAGLKKDMKVCIINPKRKWSSIKLICMYFYMDILRNYIKTMKTVEILKLRENWHHCLNGSLLRLNSNFHVEFFQWPHKDISL